MVCIEKRPYTLYGRLATLHFRYLTCLLDRGHINSQRKLLFLCLEAVFITITLHMFYITPIVDFTYQCDNKIIAKEQIRAEEK